ncbi:Cysteine/O-acetylserine efflux protein [Stutzerimonas frequens]|uniref:LysE family translocator n=1 Tax=Stutzerimonas frequens TaxID=2968969 RepID=UPI000C5FAF8E|nr:LysE family translocator [Stutzerimonas frequens]MAL92027.1 lysine transporter LysE [Pseudomonas sp.]NCT77295.1 LysE family translocator [Stutzerimonas stutzeri]QFU11180.1 Cysteine/O-acetylserine efflux protein [Stutzerimonas frequens]|tara:strand:+ start:5011 stop:5598 length:588 start_codon:yes stop_codon:yes gene_type:complete
MSQLLPFMLFAFVASITPGPTNILVLSNSSRFGLGAAVPIILGACSAAALIVLLVCLGAGEWLLRHPQLQQLMTWLGLAWLFYLAWQIARSPVEPVEAAAAPRRLGALGAAGLQLVNPKVWMMALAVVGVFSGAAADAGRYAIHALLFFLIALPCLAAWALLGAGAAKLLHSAAHLRRFNYAMALLLVVSALLSL